MADPKLPSTTELLQDAYTALRAIMSGGVSSYSVGSIRYTRHNISELLDLIKYLEKKQADEQATQMGGPFQHSQAVFRGRS